jgi:hypothetical protein
MSDAPKLCESCFLAKSVKCPCGTCDLVTLVPYCPDCESDKLNKWMKNAWIKRL